MMIRFICLMLFSAQLLAATIELTWIKPELREDGAAINSIDRFNLYQTVDNGVQSVIEVDSTLSSYQIPDVSPGMYTFQISAVEGGTEGGLSTPIVVNVKEPSIYKPVKMILSIELIE